MQHRRGEIDVACRAAELDRDPAAYFHAFKLLEKIDMKIRAPELAIGNPLQTPAFLRLHNLADRTVFDFAQLGRIDLAFLAPGACVLQFLGAQKAAYMVSFERGLRTLGHVHSSPLKG